LIIYEKNPSLFQGSDTFRFGGANGDRTRDLLVANEALSQLSYGPKTRSYYSESPLALQQNQKSVFVFED
jgi:hypothetical protein